MPDIDVFISYKREQRDLADQIVVALKEAGYVSVTDFNIQRATQFGEVIDRMIKEAQVVLVLWTCSSIKSDWVRTEAIEAQAQGKYLGVRIDPILANDLPIEVRRNTWLDLSGSSSVSILPTIVSEIKRLVGSPKLSEDQADYVINRVHGDLEFYQVVHEIGTSPGYERYIEVYPNGTYLKEAQGHIRRLSRWWQFMTRIPFWGIIGTISAVVGAYAAFVSIPKNEVDIFNLQDKNTNLSRELSETQAQLELKATQIVRLQSSLIEAQKSSERERNPSVNPKRGNEFRCVINDGFLQHQGILVPEPDNRCIRPNETRLRLSGTLGNRSEVSDLSPIAALSRLKKLDLSFSTIRDLTPLSSLAALQVLNLDGTDVENLDAINELPGLRALHLQGTPVKDVSSLLQIETLHHVTLPDGTSAGSWLFGGNGVKAEVREAILKWQS